MASTHLLNAGFCTSYLWSMRHALQAQAGIDLLELMRPLACFHLTDLHEAGVGTPPTPEIRQAVDVYRGLLTRGLPTLAPLSIERAVLRPLLTPGYLAESGPGDKSGKILFQRTALPFPDEAQWHADLLRAHVAVDPRVTPAVMDTAVFDSKEETAFYTGVLAASVGPGVAQFCEPQTPFDRLVAPDCVKSFVGQRVDFSIALPGTRLVVEVDGPQHKLDPQKSLDLRRDRALGDDGWSVLRIDVDNLTAPATTQALSQHVPPSGVTEIANALMQTPLWAGPWGLSALQVALAPLGVARLQLALLRAVDEGVLSLRADRWRVVIVERDVKCAAMAVLDFHAHLTHIFTLFGVSQPLPALELDVFTTPEFAQVDSGVDRDALLARGITVKYHDWSDGAMCAEPADLLIDLAVLQRNGMSRMTPTAVGRLAGGGAAVELRSAYAVHLTREVSASMPVAYPQTDATDHTLQFFLQNIFRKRDFRDGQLAIVRRALARKPVIGLLPTGAGKSLCYQLAALLQPGMTLVVDPLVSLMVDQVQNLRENCAIDCLGELHSALTMPARDRTTAAMVSGRYKVLFIAPERLQMRGFRGQLRRFSSKWPVPYAVIDEAHCVSEWGHDFRTSYLRLADNIAENGKSQGHSPIIIALTGTASFAVLADVQREIGVTESEALVMPDSFDRSELKFRVFSGADAAKPDKLLSILTTELPPLMELTDGELLRTNGPDTKAGIVFTPHVAGAFGTQDVSSRLKAALGVDVGEFNGKMASDAKLAAQTAFTNNALPLLVATKAYGMGVDKPNIRYTIHYNIPPSLEAFYQEAGRAGRDRGDAWCWIIYSDKDMKRLRWFHRKSYPGEALDLKAALDLWEKTLAPRLLGQPSGTLVETVVPFGKGTENQRDKALYRLAILGLVKDYTIDYHKKQFEVVAQQLDDDALRHHLVRYLARYMPLNQVNTYMDQVGMTPDEGTLRACLRVLLKFVYVEIAKKRQVAGETMAEVARRAAKQATGPEQDAEVRSALLAYLQESPFTKPLNELKDEMDPAQWLNVLDLPVNNLRQLESVDGPRQLWFGCRRALEDRPDSPALLYLSSVARRLLPDMRAADADVELRRAFQGLSHLPTDVQATSVRHMRQGYKSALGAVAGYDQIDATLVRIALEELPSRNVARSVYDALPEEATKIILRELVDDLQMLNQRLQPV